MSPINELLSPPAAAAKRPSLVKRLSALAMQQLAMTGASTLDAGTHENDRSSSDASSSSSSEDEGDEGSRSVASAIVLPDGIVVAASPLKSSDRAKSPLASLSLAGNAAVVSGAADAEPDIKAIANAKIADEQASSVIASARADGEELKPAVAPVSAIESAVAPSLQRARSLASSPLKKPEASPTNSRKGDLLPSSPLTPDDDALVSNAPVVVELDEYEKILRLLEPGDDVLPGGLYACARVQGLDKVAAVLVLCSQHLYVIDNFTFDANGQLLSIDPASSSDEPLFSVAVTARPVSVPWHSEDAQGRDTTEGGAGGRLTSATPTLPLAPEDIVLHVSKLTKNEDMPAPAAAAASAASSKASPESKPLGPAAPENDPDDPVLSTLTPRGEANAPSVVKLSYASLREMYRRRYSLMTIGLELFTGDGVTLLLVFDSPEERDQVHNKMIAICELRGVVGGAGGATLGGGGAGTGASMDTGAGVGLGGAGGGSLSAHALELGLSLGGPGLSAPTPGKMRTWRKTVTAKWVRGELSNYAYLMFLNTFSGRSYNDFTQSVTTTTALGVDFCALLG
jgi:hypothetical protein